MQHLLLAGLLHVLPSERLIEDDGLIRPLAEGGGAVLRELHNDTSVDAYGFAYSIAEDELPFRGAIWVRHQEAARAQKTVDRLYGGNERKTKHVTAQFCAVLARKATQRD